MDPSIYLSYASFSCYARHLRVRGAHACVSRGALGDGGDARGLLLPRERLRILLGPPVYSIMKTGNLRRLKTYLESSA